MIDQGTVGTDADFVEVHIFGPITPKAIEKVIGPIPTKGAERIIFRGLQSKLRNLNIGFEAI